MINIMLDAGHGGNDPGALGQLNLKEKDVTLTVTLSVGAMLAEAGLNVGFTRTTDTYISLDERANKANKAKSEYFLSIHTNSAEDTKANGIETYAFGAGGKGEKLARAVQESLIEATGRRDRGFKTANFAVLRETDMPAALTELMFIRNLEEEALLRDAAYQKRLAQAIVDGVLKFFGIAKTGTPILGKPTATEVQAFDWAMSKGATAVFGSNSAWYWALATLLGIDPVAAYAQYAKETGFGRFGGVLDASFNNPCGMKNSQGGSDTDPSAHKRFKNWEQGIQAQLDHLALYAGADGYPKASTDDPRHFPYIFGKCRTVESLGGCWAPSSEYGNGIVKMMREIQAMPVEIKPPTDWTTKYVEWGTANGIMDGTRLDEPATRVEVLKMIYEAVHAG